MTFLVGDSLPAAVARVAPWWVARVEAERPVRGVVVELDGDVLVVAAVPVGVTVADAAWTLAGEVLATFGHDQPVRLALPGVTYEVSPVALAEMVAGCSRRRWATLVEVALTPRGT